MSSKNATTSSHQVVVCGDLNLVAMVCCVVLSVVNLLMLVLFIALAAYVLNYRRRRTPPVAPPRPPATEVHPNPAYVPEETPRDPRRPRRANSSLSSAGLCEVLFPPKHEGEVIYATPPHPRVRAVAGRVYATPRGGGRRLLRRSGAPHVASMEWDYFEPAAAGASSEDSDRRNAVNICWV